MNSVQSLYVLVLSVCLSCLCAHAEDRPEKSAQTAAETRSCHVDAGDYAASWPEASPYLQGTVPEQAWVASLRGLHKPLGTVVSRTLQSEPYTHSVPGAPDGPYDVAILFRTHGAQDPRSS